MKKGDTLTSVVSEVSGGDKKQTVEVNVDDTDKEGELEFSQEEKFEAVDRIDENVGDVGDLSLLDETVGELSLLDESNQATISVFDEDVEVLESWKEEFPYNGGVGIVEDSSEEGLLESAEIDENVKDTDTDGDITEEAVEESSSADDDRINEEAAGLLKLELEANQRRQEIEIAVTWLLVK